ncbi:MAG: transcription-repair coupling factor [Epulopiscium sp.]|nr:transcription-repair coupling factor [Candidatus Epulonipiscium sp.]
MNSFLQPLYELPAFQESNGMIVKNKTPIWCSGVLESQKTHWIYGMVQKQKRPAIIITYTELRCREIYEDLSFFMDEDIVMYPAKDLLFYHADVHSHDIVRQRLIILEKLLSKQTSIVIVSIEGLLDKLIPPTVMRKWIFQVAVGHKWNMDEVLIQFIEMGYERVEQVEDRGQFAVRGGIIDLFPMTGEDAYRLELWDDEVDSIRIMNPETQRSAGKIDQIQVFPAKEQFLVSDEDGKNTSNIFEYIGRHALIFLDEPLRIEEKCERLLEEFEESIKNRLEKGKVVPSQLEEIYRYDDLVHLWSFHPQVILSTLLQPVQSFSVKETIHIGVKSIQPFHQKVDVLAKDLAQWVRNRYRIIILVSSQSRGERLVESLQEHQLPAFFRKDMTQPVLPKEIIVTIGRLNKGFEYTDLRFVVLSETDVFGERRKKRRPRFKDKGKAIQSFTDLKVGDYVAHENHGIGVYQGIENMLIDGIGKDYLKIRYADGGNLYVPAHQLDMVQKYIGSEGKVPKIHKLGGTDWLKTKSRAKKAVADLAKDLVELYAKRQQAVGYSFSEDTVWQKEFEELFPYEETDDQLVAIEETKKDMESSKVMDRLLCGDVGYGKTEVAIRAAFKAVQDGKQVAYLVPTTILAQQHYNTFIQRMKDFPIKIELLSRFRTTSQQKQSLENLRKGTADIVIATHRLLSKDVKFKDLGLLIVDEEQRFGVAHKEKMKQIKQNVDVLTLTATPIPRTLHMSLIGIRDMSILEEPPQERHPVQTYVMEYRLDFIKDAIERELNRGGQVYYLHNRVKNIEKITFELQELLPNATVAYAHGQMAERELEDIMLDFIEGEIDVLVCTTIIETGLDISNVNTIIIQDADHMGLSQLYQLRGRVGRSNRLAYAYLMYQKDKVLQENAEKRLQAIKEFTEFGSGFKIAMRDLEIRGAGNLLGAEQHGHMEAIGYDMYCKLLQEAIGDLQDDGTRMPQFETSVDLDVNAYISEEYIQNELQKLEMYKKMAAIQNQEDFYDIQEELEDRYGDIPSSVGNLLDIALIKAEAHELGISSIVQKNEKIIFTYTKNAPVDPTKIPEVIRLHRNQLLFTAAPEPYFTYKMFKAQQTEVIRQIKNVLQGLNHLKLT